MYEFSPSERHITLTLGYEDYLKKQKPKTVAAADVVQNCSRSDAEWLSAVRLSLPDPELNAAFDRSLLALRLLTYEPTGAIVAAATASFPSEPGGTHNWDYRYCWVRDGCYTARTFDLAGCPTEAGRLYRFLLDRETHGQWTSPLWAIEPDYATDEEQVAGLRGPTGEQPIRMGNAAARQQQHDSPGHVISGVYDHCRLTGQTALATRYWQSLARAADWCSNHWAELEAGIWEKRDRNRAWVHGRALCWVALRDAIRLADLLNEPAPSHWAETVAEISRGLLETGWSEEKGAFLRACGEPSIYDISALTLLLEDLVSPDDPRMQRTIETLAKHLEYRSGFRRDEDDRRYPFYLATFWMIRALQRIGEYDRAYAHLHAMIAGATNLDLMAEYSDPITSRQYGNFPQAFSHAELVRALIEMVYQLDEGRLVIFPAIPDAWIVRGNTLAVSDIPLGMARGSIAVKVSTNTIEFTALVPENLHVIIPRRYFEIGKRVRLNGVEQN